jgi:Lon protease-like protein
MALDLQVFETRYVRMLKDILEGRFDSGLAFGVVMIARGSEVGGGEERTHVGCMAEIQSMTPALPTNPKDVGEDRERAGPIHLSTVGGSRFGVERWFPDDPYPIAEVQPLIDLNEPMADMAAIRSTRARLAEIWQSKGVELPPLVPPADDPVTEADQRSQEVWSIALSSPIGALDRHRLLEASSQGERAALLLDALETQIAVATLA